jgi:uncharacterized protein (DUF2147 family)
MLVQKAQFTVKQQATCPKVTVLKTKPRLKSHKMAERTHRCGHPLSAPTADIRPPSNGRLQVRPRELVLGALITCTIGGAASADPTGLWRAADGSTMRIAACGPAICGFVASAVPANDPATGRPSTDKHNPDPAKRTRPLVGVQVLINMRPNGTGKWAGQLYNSDNGGTYQGYLIEQGPNSVRVQGCSFGICGGENLTRVR